KKAAAQKPGKKSREIYAKDPRHSGPATDRCEQAKRFEFERFLRFSGDACDDVIRENFPFARRVLRSQRTIVARGGIRDQGAIAQRQKAVATLHLEIL